MFEGPIPELELTRVDLTLPAGAKETRVVTRPTSLKGSSAWTVKVLAGICLNGSVPNWAGDQFLDPACGLPIRSPATLEPIGLRFRRAVARFTGTRAFRRSASRRPRWWMCSGPSRPRVVQRAPDLIPDEKLDELFAAFDLHRDRLW